MNIRGTTRLAYVFGDPVAHSLSPFMQNEAIRLLGADMCYLPLHVSPDDLKAAAAMLRLPNVAGANVTIPHKQHILDYLDTISGEAEIIGAVNTVCNREGRLWGTTTDPDGIVKSLEEEGMAPEQGERAVILGSGGSARTVAFALAMRDRHGRLHLAARAPYKLEPIAAELEKKLGVRVSMGDLSAGSLGLVLKESSLVVNCTSVGMLPNVDGIPVDPQLLGDHLAVYDLVYNPIQTRLIAEAKKQGCKAASGLGMLIHQGRKSLSHWLGCDVSADVYPRRSMEEMLSST